MENKKEHNQNYVFVQDKNGIPLMPTKRFRKIRLLLKNKHAKVVSYDPFTVKNALQCR